MRRGPEGPARQRLLKGMRHRIRGSLLVLIAASAVIVPGCSREDPEGRPIAGGGGGGRAGARAGQGSPTIGNPGAAAASRGHRAVGGEDVDVVVYGIAPSGANGRGRMRAELEARKLMLLAAGAGVSCSSNNLHLSGTGNTRGSRVAGEFERAGFSIVKLEGAVTRAPYDGTQMQVSAVTRSLPLTNGIDIMKSILEDARSAIPGCASEPVGGAPSATAQTPGLPSVPGAPPEARLLLTGMNLTKEGTPPAIEYAVEVQIRIR